MVPCCDVLGDERAAQPTEDRHERLKQAEMKRQAKDGPRTVDEPRGAGSQAHGERIHRQAEGDQQDFYEAHSGEIPSEPGGDDATGVFGILPLEQEVIGTVERDEAFRLARHRVETFGRGDGHDVVVGRVEDQQGEAQVADDLLHAASFEVVDELLFDVKPAADQDYLGLAGLLDFRRLADNGLTEVSQVGRGRYRDDRDRGFDVLAACITAAPPSECPMKSRGGS